MLNMRLKMNHFHTQFVASLKRSRRAHSVCSFPEKKSRRANCYSTVRLPFSKHVSYLFREVHRAGNYI